MGSQPALDLPTHHHYCLHHVIVLLKGNATIKDKNEYIIPVWFSGVLQK